MLLDISENRAAHAQDELWLLQTDLEYFLSVAGYFECQWYDRVPGLTKIRNLDAEEKYDNIGHTITEKGLIRACDWQWPVELCQSVIREFETCRMDTRPGEELPKLYERELGFLFTLVKSCLLREQNDLQRLTLKSREFQHNFRVKRTIDSSLGGGWALEYEFNDYKDSYCAERIGWCFYHLMQDSECSASFENVLVLQQLENYLNSQPQEEAGRLDQEIYRCLSDIAALEKMAELLDYHRPIFDLPDAEELRQDPRQVFQVKDKLQQASGRTDPVVGLGQALKPLCGFTLPKKRDRKWLAQRDLGCRSLSELWKMARDTYQGRLRAASIPQEFIDPQLSSMEECDSPENVAGLAAVRRETIDQIKASDDLRKAEIDMTVKERAGLLQASPKDKKRGLVVTKTKRQLEAIHSLDSRTQTHGSRGHQYYIGCQKPQSHGRSSNGCFQIAVKALKTVPGLLPPGKNSSRQWVL